MQHTVGISEMCISSSSEDVIVTYSLGSCVGVSLFDSSSGLGAMIHCMLPLSKKNPAKAETTPCMFVDTGVSLMLQEMFNRGAKRESIIAKVAGGGMLMDSKKMFKIGDRNYAVCRKILWKNNILIDGEDVGGTNPRTMSLNLSSGETTIKSRGLEMPI
ncbi:MAG: chemotaxis protein CheD [Planctomycetota bacterium]|jgi:chemotaxis protein CheD